MFKRTILNTNYFSHCFIHDGQRPASTLQENNLLFLLPLGTCPMLPAHSHWEPTQSQTDPGFLCQNAAHKRETTKPFEISQQILFHLS